MNSERKHSRGTDLAAAVPAEVRIYMAKVAEAYEAEGVSYKRQRERFHVRPVTRFRSGAFAG